TRRSPPVTLESTRTPFFPSTSMAAKTTGEYPVASKMMSNGPCRLTASGSGRASPGPERPPRAPTRAAVPRRLGRARRLAAHAPPAASARGPPVGARRHPPPPRRPPHPESTLDLVGLRDPFLDHGRGVEQHPRLQEPARHLHDVFRIVDVVLGEIPVAQIDP